MKKLNKIIFYISFSLMLVISSVFCFKSNKIEDTTSANNFGTTASTSCKTTAQLLNFTGTGFTDTWQTITWTGLSSFRGRDIWTDGNRIFYSDGTSQYYYDFTISSWVSFTWSNPTGGWTNLRGRYIWFNGNDIIYCETSNNYAYYGILDTINFTISQYTSARNLPLLGLDVWHIGSSYYFSNNTYQYYFDNSTNLWINSNPWLGTVSSNILGRDIWTDGYNIYYSNLSYQFYLDINTNTWFDMTWTGLSNFQGENVWTDGNHIFYTNGLDTYLLDISSHSWSLYSSNNLNTNVSGNNIWTDGYDIFYNNTANSLVLQKSIPIISQLITPVITKTAYNQISWTTIANAEYYEIYKNNELYDTTQDTFFNVDSLGNYQVIAVGDDVNYSNSELSNTISITSSQLTSPTISINNDLITWLNIQNANSYEIYLDNELLETININSYTITQNGNYQVKAISNSLFFTNSNFSNTLYVNYQYAKVVFYAKDNITELMTIENWLIGKSLYNFTNSFYSYQNLLTLIAEDSGYTLNHFIYNNIYVIFNDNQLFENSYFIENFIVSSDINIYYKIVVPPISLDIYNNYTLSSSNSIDLFNNLGDNLISDISLNTITVKFDYLTSFQISTITTDFLIDNYNIGDNFSVYIDSYGNEFYFDCFVTQDNSNYIYYNYLYRSNIKSSTFIIPCMNFNDFVILNNGYYEFIGNLQNTSILIPNTNFGSSFTYNQNMSFYYCNYFGFTFNIENYNTNNVANNFNCYIYDNNNKAYEIKYDSQGTFHTINNFNYILINSDNFNNYLYNKTYLSLNFQSLLAVNGLSNTYNNKNDCISALENLSIKFSFGSPILYYYNTTDKTDSSTGTGLIPTNSDGLYKTDFAWYDVTAYIYNFFIYLLFDMPIISNITQLIYQIINLILFVFNQIILLFSGVTNNIFIVAILGFLILKFVVNLLVK